MSDKLGMSLDDIISSDKTKFSGRKNNSQDFRRRRGGRSFRGGNNLRQPQRNNYNRQGSYSQGNRNGNVDGQWSHDMYSGGNSGGTARRPVASNQSSGSSTLNVANLAYTVSDADLRELFAEFGRLKSSAIHYDRSGRSLGTAKVIFENRSDAITAKNQYHDVDLDNRPMRISYDEERQGAQRPITNNDRPLKRLGPRNDSKPSNGFNRRRGGFRGRERGGRGGGRNAKPEPTADELDAELDAYAAQVKK